jgi:hypothetical protein
MPTRGSAAWRGYGSSLARHRFLRPLPQSESSSPDNDGVRHSKDTPIQSDGQPAGVCRRGFETAKEETERAPADHWAGMAGFWARDRPRRRGSFAGLREHGANRGFGVPEHLARIGEKRAEGEATSCRAAAHREAPTNGLDRLRNVLHQHAKANGPSWWRMLLASMNSSIARRRTRCAEASLVECSS